MRWLTLLLAVPLLAQAPAGRPNILGVAHVAFFVSDLQKARTFYGGLLGFAEPFTLPRPDGSIDIAFVKINDRQWIELFTGPSGGEGQLNHIALYTEDAERMREYLASRKVSVPSSVGKGRTGNKEFTVKDPDGHSVEFVEYQPDSLTGADSDRHMPSSRLSDRALHLGILVGNLERATAFYTGILGFQEFWRGAAANSPTLSWVNMRVPEGTDYLELMLYGRMPAAESRGSAHHLCLEVPDIDKAVAALQARTAATGYTRPIAVRTGINRRRQVNLFDPDGTRVELMEPHTVDGQPAPSSTLPPPRAAGSD
jgi:lactoylglutathione lyase